ncbi:MAG: hypothetical protein NVS4B3_18130 [Gemmatimonadaceae bacterium]
MFPLACVAIGSTRASQAQRVGRSALAVMPFNNGTLKTATAEVAPLSRGISDLLAKALARRTTLRVVEREEVRGLFASQHRVDGETVDREAASRVGRVLGASHVIFGGFIADADGSLRLDVRSVDAQTEAIEYVETITNRVDSISELVDQVADRVASRLHLPRAEVRLPPASAGGVLAATAADDVARDQGVNGLALPDPVSGPSPLASHITFAGALLYSRGLEARDAGNRRLAAVCFRQVVAAFPRYEPAQRQLRQLQPKLLDE